jgi:CheY-like chemotaxis protein
MYRSSSCTGVASIEAVDADEAFAILESRSDIALMLTDIQMPGSMDGLQLAQTVHKRWPPIKIIVVSAKLANIDIPADSRFFGKPLEARS